LKQIEQIEQEEMSKYGKAKDQKVTRAMIEERREAERIEEERRKKKEEQEDYIEENINQVILKERAEYIGREDELIDARSVNEALSQMSVGVDGGDKHPEKRMKAAYLAYEEANMPILKQENPSLKFTQLKEMLWKQWLKSPENPLNQTH